MKKIGFINARGNRFPVQMWAAYPAVALPEEIYSYHEEFIARPDMSATPDDAAWLASIVDAGVDNAEVIAVEDGVVGGVLLCTTNNAINDENALQLNGEQFMLAASKKLWYETMVKMDDVTKADVLVGLHISDTEPFAAVTHGVYFRRLHTGNLIAVTENAATETLVDTGILPVNLTFNRLGFYFNGAGYVFFYVDGVLVGESHTNIPAAQTISPGYAVKTSEAVVHSLYLDYIKAAQLR